MSFLTGSKTYIVAGILLVISILQMFGITFPGIPPLPLGDAIGGVLASIGLITGRMGAKNDAAKAVVITNGGTVATAKTAIAATK